ncbi:hypothetical protein ACFFRR_008581 [Megaselia abdita]
MDFENNPQLYLSTVLNFLEKYSWIYTSSNTNFIRDKIIDSFPKSWTTYFQSLSLEELNRFPLTSPLSSKQPETLQNFCSEILSFKRHYKQDPFTEKDIYFKKMSPKKLHEISRLSYLIESVCKTDEALVDFGSGLGYLSEILYKKRRWKILGLECDEERVRVARERQQKFYPESKGDIIYKTEFISERSAENIEEYLEEISTELPISIIGLHSCADLTVTSIKLFLEMKRVKNLIVMPCCYHKLKLKGNAKCEFENFPLSKQLKDLYKGNFLNRPFLRLACQETASRWSLMTAEEHLTHSRNMFQRAALEVLLKEGESFRKRKGDFSEITEVYDIHCEDLEQFQDNYRDLLKKFGDTEFSAEVLTCLQATIQSICEDLVLNDRILYIKEMAEEIGVSVNVRLRKIVDDSLSPRCFALVAQKVC